MGRIGKSIQYLIFIAALILAGEIVMRIFYGDGFLTKLDPQIHHSRRAHIDITRKWGSGEKFRFITNSLGWRDDIPKRRVKKMSDKQLRIVFLGDSFTEAVGFDQDATFSGIAGELLRKAGYDCEVLNAGTASYSPLIEYMQLKRFLDKGYKADIVVLLPDLSDVQDEVLYSSRFIFDKDNEPLRFNNIYYKSPLIYGLLNNSCLVRSAAQTLKNLYDARTARVSKRAREQTVEVSDISRSDLATQSRLRGNWELHTPSLSGWAKSGLVSLELNIQRIRRLCDKNGIKLIVVIYPWPQQLYIKDDPVYYEVLKGYFRELYEAREGIYGKRPSLTPSLYETALMSFSRREGISLVNLYPEFVMMEGYAHKLYIANDIHMNKEGHNFVGGMIADKIIEKIR